MAPETPNVLLNVVAPVTPNVLLNVVAADIPNVPVTCKLYVGFVLLIPIFPLANIVNLSIFAVGPVKNFKGVFVELYMLVPST